MENEQSTPANILICWIGDTDLLAFGHAGILYDVRQFRELAKTILAKDKEGTLHDIDKEIQTLDTNTRNSSIVLAINKSGSDGIPVFSDVLLLTNRPQNDLELLKKLQDLYPMYVKSSCKSFKGNINVSFVPDSTTKDKGVNGWNYQDVLTATRKVLTNHFNNGLDADQAWYNVTPGTMAQSTSLILLGKELSHNSNFIQVEKSRNRVEHCQIPFDINKVILNQAAHIETQAVGECRAIGSTPSFKDALDKARRIAQYPVTVLLTGESGTGKEVIAEEIHRLSGRKGKFVPINCAMLSRETGVAELTGVFKGAYTDATETHGGKFHEAINGTLFLDEIGDCPLDVQSELLRFLQPLDAARPSERRWHLKGSEPKKLSGDERMFRGVQKGNIRIIAATNKNLLDQALFRQDLYYRLETIQIKMPTLETRKAETDEKARINDIKELADTFLFNSNKAFSLNKIFHKNAYEALMAHRWTGNVRELQNVITRVVLLSKGDTITADDIRNCLNQDMEENPTDPTDNLKTAAEALARHDIAKGGITFEEREKEFRHAYCTAAQKTAGTKKAAYKKLDLSAHTFDGYLK